MSDSVSSADSPSKIFTLSQVAASLQSVVTKNYPGRYWIKAEMARLHRYPHSGHCYPDLVEKQGDKVVTQFRAIIWADTYAVLNRRFEEVTGRPLHDGMSILFQASVTFNPQYGLSLHIHDIEPSFTLGEMARQRQAAINRLKNDGEFDLNHKKSFPMLPARIAVISVETSKGYNDFCNILTGHGSRYRLQWELFPALLQGVNAGSSIIGRLEEIDKEQHLFDLVVIVRGGGGEVGLDCYDDYTLARVVARFPLPVVTGIGHATNQTVVEMVAHANKITPTDVAYTIVDAFRQAENNINAAALKLTVSVTGFSTRQRQKLDGFSRIIASVAERSIGNEKNRLTRIAGLLPVYSRGVTGGQRQQLEQLPRRLTAALTWLLREKKNQIGHLEILIKQSDPVQLLRKGYSLTLSGGRIVRSVAGLSPGTVLTTRMADGEVISTVENITLLNLPSDE